MIRRRNFVTLLGGIAAAWPLAAGAQQTKPTIGFLNGGTRQGYAYARYVTPFRQGLKIAGYVEFLNVNIEYRFAGYQNERLALLATDLVQRQVSVIAAGGAAAAVAAKAATKTIPIIFEMDSDPVQLGLVASLNRPGGNATGTTQLNVEVGAQRLELLHTLIPSATAFALLVNPTESALAETYTINLQAAAHSLGLELHVLHASTERDFDAVFARLIQLRVGGLVIAGGPFAIDWQEHLAALAIRHAVPAIFNTREFVAAGGLMSYGSSSTDAYRRAGVYTGRVLKGEKPSELPVQQATKVELILNLETAKALGLTVPPRLLAIADEVIE